jgi:hypothetical protein
MPPHDESKIKKLNETLYSRSRYHNPLDERAAVTAPTPEAPQAEAAWGGTELSEILSRERKPQDKMPVIKKLFLFAALFFGATLVVAAFVFFGGANFISSKNVDLEITGPTEAEAGEPVELKVAIKNGNNADLDSAVFSVQYPNGARNPTDSSQALTFSKEDLGKLKAGDEAVRNVSFLLIGQKGEAKELKFSVQYKVAGSNATFYKDKLYDLTIGDSPLSLEMESPASVTSGESFPLTLTVKQNSTEVLKNVMLRAEYPYGYTPASATPQAFAENNTWALGDLSPGATKKIQIMGRLTGENKDERTFRFYVGSAEGGAPSANFKNILLSDQKTVLVDRPSLDLEIAFNGERPAETYIAPAGQRVDTTITFQNNLPEKLVNPRLEARFEGSGLDEASVTAINGGFYNSALDRLVWDFSDTGTVNELAPGATRSVSFRFASKADAVPGKNRDIGISFVLTGTPVGSAQAISVSENRVVKVASQVTLGAKMLHSTGLFKNAGPIPPKVEQETTYTAVLTAGNTQSELTDAKVTARLGSAVKWKGSKSAQPENISYDEASNTVTWNIGTLAAGTGFSTAAREAQFQVGLTPSLSQVGSAPTLVSSITFTAYDPLAAKTVTLPSQTLTTNMPSDPAFIQGDGIVVK